MCSTTGPCSCDLAARGAHVQRLILVRHAHAASNVSDVVSGVPPGEGLSPLGREQALALQSALAGVTIDLGVHTELLRTQETLAIALQHRGMPVVVLPALNEMAFGSFEGGLLSTYRTWAWGSGPAEPCPGGGESRAHAAQRFSDGLEELLARPEETVLAISHALPVRYILDASDGRFPASRIEPIPHAVPAMLEQRDVATAAATLRAWAGHPEFIDTPFGG
jgi:broad specificity phosphatase PhoE